RIGRERADRVLPASEPEPGARRALRSEQAQLVQREAPLLEDPEHRPADRPGGTHDRDTHAAHGTGGTWCGRACRGYVRRVGECLRRLEWETWTWSRSSKRGPATTTRPRCTITNTST